MMSTEFNEKLWEEKIVDKLHKTKKSFWDTDTSKKLMTVLIIAGFILLAGGVGTNVVKEVYQSQVTKVGESK